MPFYEYDCEDCGTRFEVVQRISDPAVGSCKECASPKVRKVIFPSAVIYKGGGYYVTEYGRSKSSGDTGTDKQASTDSGKSGEGGGDSKPKDASAKPASTPGTSGTAGGTSTPAAAA